MFTVRSMRWPDDRNAICALDTSFTTERVFRVVASASAFHLHQGTISPPLHKRYDLTEEVEQLPTMDYVLIAERDTQVVGVAALSYDAVDHRAILRHLYVDRAFRGQRIGRALMDAMVARAHALHARCLWLETQDVNYDAIQFYHRAGFHWCGLDRSLDEHDGSATDETAVFFMRRLE